MNDDPLWTAAQRPFDARDPATLERTARSVRLALGAVVVAQFMFPDVLQPLFSAWIVPLTGAPVALLTRTSYLLGLAPWALLAATHVAHARLLRRVGFPFDDAQVVWMTLVPGYNVPGTVRLFDATARALVAAGAPARLARDLHRAAIVAVVLGVAVPLEWVYALGTSGGAPVTGTGLFAAAFLLLVARIFLLLRLHFAFSAEPVRRALLALPVTPVADAPAADAPAADAPAADAPAADAPAAEPPSKPPPSGATAPATPAASAPARPAWSALGHVAILVGVAAVLVFVTGITGRLRRDPEEVLREASQGVIANELAREAERIRSGSPGAEPATATPVPAAAAPRHAPGEPEPAAVALAARLAAPGAILPPPPEPLYGGRTVAWWEERIALLRQGIGEDAQRLADLTVARARANGLSVVESAGSVQVTPPGGPGGRP